MANGWNCMLYIHFPPNLTTSVHYLVKRRCSKFYLTPDLLQSDHSDLVSKLRWHIVATTFFLRGHCQTCAGCPEMFFYVSTRWRPRASNMRHRRFPGARERREKRVVVYALVSVYGAHFEQEFWQCWSHLSWQLITLLSKPVYCVLIQSSDSLLQIIHINVVTTENIWVSQGKALTCVTLGGKCLYSIQF